MTVKKSDIERNSQNNGKGQQSKTRHDSMAMRGVTRPHTFMKDGPMGEHRNGDANGDTNGSRAEQERQHPMGMSHADRVQMQQKHHEQTLWVPHVLVVLGVWLMTCPFTFGYGQPASPEVVARTAGRGWLSLVQRGVAMSWNDVVCGLLLLGLGLWWMWTPRLAVVPWAACFIGIWLQFAPLIFWSPQVVGYAMDTFIGAWVIALTILIRGMPPMIMIMKMGPETPPGWSYNPSSWLQRVPLVITGFLGWFISRYLAAYQLGYIDQVWDPFFDHGSVQVLTSKVSESWPLSDAGLGAFAYTFEALMAYMGGVQRWRTMPWMVTFFGILVIPLGLTHITLVILQPVVVGHWCTLCIAAALVMLVMIPLTVDEVVAMCQFLVRSVRDGKPFWRTFWKGDTIEGGSHDERTPHYKNSPRETLPAMIWGVSVPWNLLLSTGLGLWLVMMPSIFGMQNRTADNNHLAGSIVITISVIVMAEVLRAGRYLNVLLGVWIIASAWVLPGAPAIAQWSNVATGLILILLSIPRGTVREHYGNWDHYVI